ncbi:MAG: phage major capsid protein [Desulfuromonadaceae bacterium]|nr:phage major capsid protein [Desulfuromonadaceae bacterium]MDD5106287.1 phage major capsid protein [Desulfuromonadaceae bacterium]
MFNYTPALEKSNDKQLHSFKRHFLKDAEDFAVNIDGSAEMKELHAKRSELKQMARSILDKTNQEKRGLSDVENEAYETTINLLNDIQVAFDTRSEKEMITRSLAGINGTTRATSNSSLETWIDIKTRKAVPVLGKEHRFADHVQRNGNEFSARDYWACLAGHPVSQEVRAAMGAGTDVNGGFLTLPEFLSAEVIDLMRSKNVVTQAGARTIPLPAATCRVCKVDSDPQASWVGENQLIPDTNMEIGAIDFVSHKLTTLIKISRELLQDAGNAGTVIMNAIATAMALELDSAALLGDGNGKPLGIFNNTHINTYSMGDNGNVLNGYDDLLYGVREIVNVNGPIPATAVMSPRTLVEYSLLKDGNGLPLVKPDLIKNMQFFDTTKVPVNQTQGTSGAVCSSILLGGFNELVIGIRSVLEIQVLQEKYADYGQVGYLATMRADTALYQPKSICKIIGVKP